MGDRSVGISQVQPDNCQVTFFALASCIIWLRTPVCSRHPANPGIPPFWIEVLTYPFSIMCVDILFASTEKKILHSALSREMVLNWLKLAEASSLGTKQPSASLVELCLSSRSSVAASTTAGEAVGNFCTPYRVYRWDLGLKPLVPF